jgi:hypothetical protein
MPPRWLQQLLDSIPDHMPGEEYPATVVNRPVPELILVAYEDGHREHVDVPTDYPHPLRPGTRLIVVKLDGRIIDWRVRLSGRLA